VKRSVVVLVTVLALAGSACGEDSGRPRQAAPGSRPEVAVSREVLVAAQDAARAYGREHLGHYLKLRRRDLLEGVEVPQQVSLKLSVVHTAYCVRAVNRSIPLPHPWRIATVGDRSIQPTSADSCTKTSGAIGR
jgi:hypothetical protein